MPTAFFVESINVKEVPIIRIDDHDAIKYCTMGEMESLTPVAGGPVALMTAEKVREHVVPVHEFCEAVETDGFGDSVTEPPNFRRTYIALSEEVQRYLRLPIDLLAKELNGERKRTAALEKMVTKLTNEQIDYQCKVLTAPFWRRLKFLFTRRF